MAGAWLRCLTAVNAVTYHERMNPNTDQRASIIARRFCTHAAFGASRDGCAVCLSKATAALQEIAGQGSLLELVPNEPALSDPDANTPGVERADSGDTTNAARWAVMPRTGSQRRRILNAFIVGIGQSGNDWTDDELIVALGMTHQSVGPRRGELVAGGWLEDSGHRRPTRSGQAAVVWRLTLDGWRRVAAERRQTA